MELTDRLKKLKTELGTATDLEKINELSADIVRVRKAIMLEKELRSPALPPGVHPEEKRVRLMGEDQEQVKFEMEYRAAHVGEASETNSIS